MDLIAIVRLLAHLLAFGWFVVLFLLASASEGRSVRMTHTRVGRAAILLVGSWFVLLMLSVRGVAVIPREANVPVLAALELGGWILAWVWLVWCGSENYRIQFRRNDRTALLLVVWLTILFLG